MPRQLFHGNTTVQSLLGDPRRWGTGFVDSLSDAELQQESPTQIVERGLAEYGWTTIEVDLQNEKTELKAGRVEVTGDFLRGLNPGEYAEVDGSNVYVYFPFTGDPKLLDARTGALMTGGVFADVEQASDKRSGNVVISVGLPYDMAEDAALRKVEQAIADAKRHLPRFLGVTNDLVQEARDAVRTAIEERISFKLEQRNRQSRLSEALGVGNVVESTQSTAPISRAAPVIVQERSANRRRGGSANRDFFICHASEDKVFVRNLVEALSALGATVWFDEYEILVGDSLRDKIERGLKMSTYGVVVVSPLLIAKKERGWIKRELGGLMARPDHDRPVVLPVWYGTTAAEVADEMPSLADTVALNAAEMKVGEIAVKLWERKLADEQ